MTVDSELWQYAEPVMSLYDLRPLEMKVRHRKMKGNKGNSLVGNPSGGLKCTRRSNENEATPAEQGGQWRTGRLVVDG